MYYKLKSINSQEKQLLSLPQISSNWRVSLEKKNFFPSICLLKSFQENWTEHVLEMKWKIRNTWYDNTKAIWKFTILKVFSFGAHAGVQRDWRIFCSERLSLKESRVEKFLIKYFLWMFQLLSWKVLFVQNLIFSINFEEI